MAKIESYLTLFCPDFDAYKTLPSVVEFKGAMYGRTGWNSDLGVAYYKTGTNIAKGTNNE